jgi:leucyl/phenylalanyl-tRNA--protein transferase
VWDRDGTLAGGLYGVAVGKVFVIESMFSRQADASKVGLVTLSAHLQNWGFVLNDGKRESGHLRSLGFSLMPRDTYNALVAEAAGKAARPGTWAVDKSIDVFEWNPRAATV